MSRFSNLYLFEFKSMNANNSEIYFFIINSMHISDIYQSTVKYCNNNFNQKVQRGLSFNCSCIQVMTYMVIGYPPKRRLYWVFKSECEKRLNKFVSEASSFKCNRVHYLLILLLLTDHIFFLLGLHQNRIFQFRLFGIFDYCFSYERNASNW